ncbi:MULTISPECIES: adenosylcobinamide-GDP ribazoletransferase [unclassified Coleofasciculus]|uniref:adenosylcobinamide-GDP ribazoletransferase n=1 Tax=unclassified Coleofasciculus TaxID=2692782 RepID=UPI0018803F74|nr:MULTISPECIES: adenosylcobinamide-GDP ribazoletransferase [unclassified Coleofasciculus]MBE9124582.1 adenosylcobinamide-GDP ribazoletransferase [Coleofasciculus sp. LEGE 07081]MBE9150371.1 adenosylcobinamide-GDP ribazoletransferase [Coleofasciculus sp. LEGE 07092]
MKGFRLRQLRQWGRQCWYSWLGAITFYTCIPIPAGWQLEFRGIARWSPLVGLAIGGILGIADAGLQQLGVPVLTRSAIIIVSWIALTGGLHLDGVMDTADGLGVQDSKRRLEVMADSVTGAFGAMTAAALLLLKLAALTDIANYRWLMLMSAAGWGRWGQVVAISLYPYLKPTGKGAFHKDAIRIPQDILWGGLPMLALCGLPLVLEGGSWQVSLAMAVGGCAIALLTGAWFYRQLGGHTGDTYGAVVEWTEALFLCLLAR